MKPAPALSIRQPWAFAIFLLGKDIENRDWPTERRGRIWIHVSKTAARSEREDYIDLVNQGFVLPPFEALDRGCIVGSVDIVDCVQEHDSPWKREGSFGFVLRDPVLLRDPVPCRGLLQFFNLPPPVREQLAEYA